MKTLTKALWVAVTCLSLSIESARAEEITLVNNVPFCSGGPSTLRMDYGKPKGGVNLPALILIHGGGFNTGTRDQFAPLVESVAKQGYFAATIDYRLTMAWTSAGSSITQPPAVFPAQAEDVNCAIRHIRANAASYGIDPNRIALMGGSSGGHLALLSAYSPTKFKGAGGYAGVSQKVAAVVNWFGSANMTTLYNTTEVPPLSQMMLKFNSKLLLLGSPQEFPVVYKDASSISYVNSQVPRTLIVHGDEDTLIPISQSTTLANKLKTVGAKYEFVVVRGGGHGFSDSEDMKYANDKTMSFLNTYLK